MRLPNVLIVAFSCAAALACNDIADPSPNAPRTRLAPQPRLNLALAAAAILRDVQTGPSQRGEEDYMLRFEVRYPGFGGYYVDSVGDLVLLLRDPGLYKPEDLRAQLDADHAARAWPSEREVWRSLGRTRIQQAAFTLSELVAIQEAIGSARIPIPGKALVGTRIPVNRVVVGFDREDALPGGLAAVLSLGVPVSALETKVTGPLHLLGTFQSRIRPTAGGTMVTVQDAAFRSNTPWGGSLAFDVVTRPPFMGASYFLMSSHVVNGWSSTNGYTGATVYQVFGAAGSNFDTLGTITVNPAWSTGGCGTDQHGNPAYYCTNADVAMGVRHAGVTPAYGVATSTAEGYNGAVGTQTINGAYAYAGVITPAMVPTTRNMVHKSGQTTGTTTGAIDYSGCYDFYSTVDFAGVQRVFEAKCVWIIDHIGHGAGDSGAPVFARLVAGGPYYALGILVGGGGNVDANGTCNDGLNCEVLFHPWAAMEQTLGYYLSP